MRLKGRRRDEAAEREVSRGRSSAERTRTIRRREGVDPGRTSEESHRRATASREGLNETESEANMNHDKARPQMSAKAERPGGQRGETHETEGREEAASATSEIERSGTRELMEQVVRHDNFEAAWKRVKANKGTAGVDGVTVDRLPGYLDGTWEQVREQLLAGTYVPAAVRRCEIPKPDGTKRQLGIPTVMDRIIQQAVLQVLQPRFDPTFSEHSYGFRPRRSAHDAIVAARRFIEDGRTWCVDVDLEKFFDRVNHDVLMGRLAKRIEDPRMLKLIRRYLTAGVMANGVVMEREEGTPQGGPLSPLLANVLLDEVDKDLEERGHAFARYADDCNVYVRSERAAQRVMDALRRKYASLRLRVNESKSAVAEVWGRKFLGYSFQRRRDGRVRVVIARKAEQKAKDRIRELTSRSRGISLAQMVDELAKFLRGWKNYFCLAEARGFFRILDEWIRHRLRMFVLRQWKRPSTIYARLRRLGLRPRTAWGISHYGQSWWRRSRGMLGRAIPNSFFANLGLPALLD